MGIYSRLIPFERPYGEGEKATKFPHSFCLETDSTMFGHVAATNHTRKGGDEP
jgi:hypothetical protein